ncbi:MAG: preprotein translocase subunit SecY [Coriobacteriia bacterium]|nr:preprotein translocase subunit SecY [Coriobacteriia bacterium]
MFNAIVNAFKVPDLRKKILFTLAIVVLYRIGAHIPAPGVDVYAVAEVAANNAAIGLLNLFTGGALEQMSIFALGIMPYITASIIMQLLKGAIPTLDKMSKEESGRRKITQITRYMAMGIALVEAIGMLWLFRESVINIPGVAWLTPILIVGTLLVGTALIIWMAELITQRGIGNGMSMMIFSSIVAMFIPVIIDAFARAQLTLRSGLMPDGSVAEGLAALNVLGISGSNLTMIATLVFAMLVVIFVVIYIEEGQRRIPVQYAKRVVGRRVMGGSGTYIPLKVNGANVIPMIFATAILTIPAQLAQMMPEAGWLQSVAAFASGPMFLPPEELMALPWWAGWGNWLITFILIVFFAYFYTALVHNPVDISDNLRKQGGFIPGIRPGQKTTDYIEKTMNRIVLPGALFLGTIAVGTSILFAVTANTMFMQFGGTSIIIMVGVSLETMRQIESQLKMRNYDGFFNKGKS